MFKNPQKFTKTMLTTERGFNKWSKHRLFKEARKVSDNYYEITKKTSEIVEKYPIHCGTAILHMSKLILLEFVKFLGDFLIEGSFELVYSGKIIKIKKM